MFQRTNAYFNLNKTPIPNNNMENPTEEKQHPNKDPLGLAGAKVGYNPKRALEVGVFSYPAVLSIKDQDGEYKDRVGEVYRYEVRMNFRDAGRKVVSYKISSYEIELAAVGQHGLKGLRKTAKDFLEHNSETFLAQNMDDELANWEFLFERDINAQKGQ